MDNLSQAIGDGSSDRITQILQQNAVNSQPIQNIASSQSVPPTLPYTPAQPVQQQVTPMQILAQKIQSGDPQANMLLQRTQTFTGGDPAATQSAMQFMIDHPNDIDPSNSYQVNTALAQWARQSGMSGGQPMAVPAQSLEMPSNQQISMQDLGNIASGKGTNFLGLQQGAAQDIANLQFRQAQENRFNAMAQNGGFGGTTGFMYNKLAQSLQSAGIPITPDVSMQLLGFARNGAKAGQTLTINGKQISIENLPGFTDALSASAGAEEGGKQGAEIAAAAPKAEKSVIGKARGEAETSLANINAMMPAMQSTVNDLIKLSDAATYTVGGQTYNALLRQLDQPMPKGAVAAAEYQARVDNVLIPQMKQMFPGRVTNFDVAAVKGLLGNQNLSPQEKKMQLYAYMSQKQMQAETDKRAVQNLGGNSDQFGQSGDATQQTTTQPAQTSPSSQQMSDPLGIRR